MKKINFSLFILLLLVQSQLIAQNQCPIPGDPGPPKAPPGCPHPNGCNPKPPTTPPINIPIVRAVDPNEIIGPAGYDSTVKWVSARAQTPYKILFENDPDFALAPAQKVVIYLPIHPKLNPNSIRLGDFGFGAYTFPVPANAAIYSNRLDLRDSLGLFVDVTAGLDVANRRAFWIFESIDPATGLASTVPANGGFLPVNDSLIGSGEGFVTLTLLSVANVQTADSIAAQATILFDTEETLTTNTWINIIDAQPPVSKANTAANVNDTITVSWSGKDDAGGSGIREYALYVSENNGPFALYQANIKDTSIRLPGSAESTYGFFIRATDNTGNEEPMKDSAEVTVQPGTHCVTEVCNGVDDDCDGLVDEGFIVTYYPDTDRDGFGSLQGAIQVTVCNPPAGYVRDSTDCNDAQIAIHPGAQELCDNVDNNCDGIIDEGCPVNIWYKDADSDGYGNADSSVRAAQRPAGYVAQSGDCNDNNAYIRPGAVELCNGVDDNCNGTIDEGCAVSTWYRDADGDGYGNAAISINATVRPDGYITRSGDCNDANPAIYPGAVEFCNGLDDDCDGVVDDACSATRIFYMDVDGDGFGRNNATVRAAVPPPGYVPVGGDCIDYDATIYPGAPEKLNGRDDNCNGLVDEGFPVFRYYLDVDGDGYGRPEGSIVAAFKPVGYVVFGGDCKDYDPAVYPGAPERLNGYDDNCNGLADEGFPMLTYYPDVDRDGYGRPEGTRQSAVPIAGYVTIGGDCKDYDATVYPGAPEKLNGYDDNCNGLADEGFPMLTYYPDVDRDGYGRNQGTRLSAIPIEGFVTVGGDCNDFAPTIYPGAPEIRNNRDDNCNGVIDEILTTLAKPGQASKEQALPDSLTVTIAPVPSTHHFNILLRVPETTEKVKISVYDPVGRLVETIDNPPVGKTFAIGGNYAKGLYMVEIVLGKQKRVMKILKI